MIAMWPGPRSGTVVLRENRWAFWETVSFLPQFGGTNLRVSGKTKRGLCQNCTRPDVNHYCVGLKDWRNLRSLSGVLFHILNQVFCFCFLFKKYIFLISKFWQIVFSDVALFRQWVLLRGPQKKIAFFSLLFLFFCNFLL